MRIAAITGSRADWNGLGMVAMALRDAEHDVRVIATGQHSEALDTNPSRAVIMDDGFSPVLVRIPLGSEPVDIADATGAATAGLGRALSELNLDLAIVIGDRYEMLGAAAAAALLRIPIAHLAGGDVTEGSIDDKLRYAITALADYHFPTNWSAAERLTWVVRKPETVRMAGSPALDRIRVTPRVTRETFFADLGLTSAAQTILVAYHPVTTERDNGLCGCTEMIRALIDLGGEVKSTLLVLGSNADAGSGVINHALHSLANHSECGGAFVANLPPSQYYSALEHCDLLVGNSSAGLYEAPSFGIPVVNIGDRQKGRIFAANVRTCAPTREAILHTIKLQLAEGPKVCVNPYGDGHSAARIAEIIGEWRP